MDTFEDFGGNMQKFKLLVVCILLSSVFIGCSDKITNILGFPEKLEPYDAEINIELLQSVRDAFLQSLPNNSIVILTTNDVYLRNGDVDFEFRPESNFYYMTGFEEPNAVAVIRPGPAGESELIMFVEERSEIAIRWLGEVYGPDGVVEYFGADSAYTIDQFGPMVNKYINAGEYDNIFNNLEKNPTTTEMFFNAVEDTSGMEDVRGYIHLMRNIKMPHEIDLIQKAVDVSMQAFEEGMQAIEPGMYEYEVDAIFDYVLRTNGCTHAAFPTIVASGPNINILHYGSNQRQMLDGDLVMIDYGAEYGYYAADVTRTLPVNGKFSDEQKDIYEIVYEAHMTAILEAAPGVSYYYLLDLTRNIILDRLLEKDIITGDKATILTNRIYRQYIPAGLGHCVGLDVHDPFPREANGDRLLRENMVLAFEPHIYLYEGDPTVDPDYWNVSARIEDVVLITSNGARILSLDLPRSVDEIEDAMK